MNRTTYEVEGFRVYLTPRAAELYERPIFSTIDAYDGATIEARKFYQVRFFTKPFFDDPIPDEEGWTPNYERCVQKVAMIWNRFVDEGKIPDVPNLVLQRLTVYVYAEADEPFYKTTKFEHWNGRRVCFLRFAVAFPIETTDEELNALLGTSCFDSAANFDFSKEAFDWSMLPDLVNATKTP